MSRLGALRSRVNVATTGMVPPVRVNTGFLWKPFWMACAMACMAG